MNSISFILIMPSYKIVIGYIITKVLTEEVLERPMLKATRSPKIRLSFESISFVSTLEMEI